ncbi:MAG: hypothetical protein RR087_09150, partial [Oscillospiraceae bacterium]
HTVTYFALFKLLYHTSVSEAAFAGVFSTFNIMCWRGMFAGILSLALKKNTFQLFSIEIYAIIITMLASIFTLIALLYYISPVNLLRIKVFFSCAYELNTVLYLHMALTLFMLFNSYNNYYNLDIIWFSMAQIITPTIMFVIYIMIFNYGIRMSNFLQRELRQENLTEQIKLRYAHRQTYQMAFNKIAEFKHNYRENVITANYCLEKNDLKTLHTIINHELPTLVENLPVIEQFSNNPEYDAALFDWYNSCLAYSIAFKATLFVPPQTTFKSQDIHTLLQLLRELHTPLAQKSKKGKSITITGKLVNNWFSVHTAGSFSGVIEAKNELPYFLVDDGVKTKTAYRNLVEFTSAEKMLITYNVDSKASQFETTVSVYCGK